MNITELKAEANALGYSISKKIIYEKPLRCPCGSRHWVSQEITTRGKYYRCPKCGYKGEVAKTKYQAIINWNKAVRDTDLYHKHREEEFKRLMEKWQKIQKENYNV